VAPSTRYAKSGDVHIAYQVVGEGPLDLVLAYGYGSNVEVQWEHPRLAAFLDDVAELGRLIVFDKRDTGLSDRTGRPPTLEQRVDDMWAVVDAVGVERPVLIGMTGGAPIAAMAAATDPDRVEALILYAAVANWMRVEQYAGMVGTDEPKGDWLAAVEETWGTGISAHIYARSMLSEPGFVDWCARYERSMASPGNASVMVWMAYQWDLTTILPTITVPSLVLWRRDFAGAVYEEVAELIPGARGVCLPGSDHWPWVGETAPFFRELRQFLASRAGPSVASRQLAAVLFTDIVGSTERAAQMGDRRWSSLLERHDALARVQIERYRGTFVKSTGDGVLATFDGPARAVRCALALRDSLRDLGIEIRAGVHVGEIEPRPGDVAGLAVHIASRVCDYAPANQVCVTRTVRDLVAGSGLRMHDRGTQALKGVPEEWSLYAATA
jgi:class 3 adenylate cyclase/pimeloyl-ACP methyl ester carboxylesterase